MTAESLRGQRRAMPGELGLGCNNFGGFVDEATAADLVDAAFDDGMTYFDTSDAYPPDSPGDSERALGAALVGRRDRARIATKFGYNFGQPTGRADAAHVRASIDASLARLRTDRIDVAQIHRPDPATPIGETLQALAELRREGKVLEIGCSNFSGALLREADAAARSLGLPPFSSDQVEHSVLVPRDDVREACEALGVGMIPYFVLASGLLTGKYRRGLALPDASRLVVASDDPIARRFANRFPVEDYLDRVEALTEWAEARNHSLLELALGWVVAQPAVTVTLIGATSVAQLKANVAAARAWTMTPAEVAEAATIAARARPTP